MIPWSTWGHMWILLMLTEEFPSVDEIRENNSLALSLQKEFSTNNYDHQNFFAVQIPGTKEDADRVALENGFINLGQVFLFCNVNKNYEDNNGL